MPIGPTLIIDKSTLQSLTVEEANWLSHHFHTNLIEPLFVEIIGALTAADRRDAVADVAALAKKMLGMGLTTTPNMRHRDLIMGNLLGLKLEMDGRIILDGVARIPLPDGRTMLYQGEPPEIEALRRLAEGTFTEREKEGATLLRKFKADVDLRRIREVFAPTPERYKAKELNEILSIVDKVLDGRGPYDALRRAINDLHLPDKYRAKIIRRWKQVGRPSLREFAPYAHHVLRVEHCFDMAIGMGLISDKDSNSFIDAMYLYYLPFCEVFASSDKLHRTLTPLFLRPDQRFVWGLISKSTRQSLPLTMRLYPRISKAPDLRHMHICRPETEIF